MRKRSVTYTFSLWHDRHWRAFLKKNWRVRRYWWYTHREWDATMQRRVLQLGPWALNIIVTDRRGAHTLADVKSVSVAELREAQNR